MRYILFSALLLSVAAQAQLTTRQMDNSSGSLFMMDVTGIPYTTKDDKTFISGTEFYNDSWQKATVVTTTGGRTRPFLGKLNLLNNQLHYLNDRNQEYVASSAIKELTLVDTITGQTVRFVRKIDLTNPNGKDLWYQELDTTSKMRLYKLYRKKHIEQKLYSSAITEHSIETTELFYLQQASGTQQIKSTKDLIEALPDKRSEMESFVKGMGRGQKLEERLIKTIQHYNSLTSSAK